MDQPFQLSGKEFNYIQDKDFLLTKHIIITKIKSELAHIEKALTHTIKISKTDIPVEVLQRAGKISKGENYRGLPYLVLDHPRYFKKEGVFAFRTMFWWGHFFSSTFHLQGKYLDLYRNNILDQILSLKNNNLYICNGATPWEYHYEPDNYLFIDTLEEKELQNLIKTKDFIKISSRLDLKKWYALEEFTIRTFTLMSQFLNGK